MLDHLKIGTRQSALALWQAEFVAAALKERYPELEIEIVKMTTKGDKILDAPLAKIGGKGLFTKELENAILDERIDIAVHSLKDMPTSMAEGLMIACVTKREDAADAFVSNKYDSLAVMPPGAILGTSSLRRKAQILARRPDLVVKDLRGNVNSRLAKLDNGEFDAAILACVGLQRLGMADRIKEKIDFGILLPAVGQGALAIEAREDDTEVKEIVACLDDADSRSAAMFERGFLRRVEGGCQVPVGVHAEIDAANANIITGEAVIASLDGGKVYRGRLSGKRSEAAKLGRELAEQLLFDGAMEILNGLGLLTEE